MNNLVRPAACRTAADQTHHGGYYATILEAIVEFVQPSGNFIQCIHCHSPSIAIRRQIGAFVDTKVLPCRARSTRSGG